MSNEENPLLIFVLKIENKCTFRFKKMYNSFWRLYMLLDNLHKRHTSYIILAIGRRIHQKVLKNNELTTGQLRAKKHLKSNKIQSN